MALIFTTPPLTIGTYKLHVESPGTKAWEGQLEIESGKTSEVTIQMSLGQVSESVFIYSSVAPLMSTVDPTEQSTLDSMRIKELPVNGRDINILISNVTPGVEEISDVNGGVRISGLIESKNATGLRNGIFGLPADYTAAQKPLNPCPKGGQPTDPTAADCDTDVVYITLNNGTRQRVTYDTGVHPWRNRCLLVPVNWVADVSLLKFFNVTEKFRMRLNLDFFNVFNRQGYNPPGTDGIVSLGSSYIANGFRPLQLQGPLRPAW